MLFGGFGVCYKFLTESSSTKHHLSHTCSFNEVSKTTYALVVSILEGSTAKISVAENRTLDVAGNPNVASVVLQVTHCK
jgi:hypothetical protein